MNTTKMLDDCRIANQQPKKITILGAGIAGLVAAYELEKLGHQVELIEGSSRIGGRVWTHRFGSGVDAPYGELGAMRIHKDHQHTLHYVHELGLGDKLCKFITVFEEHNALMNIQGKIFRIKDASKSFEQHYQGIFLATQYREKTRHFAAWLKTIINAIAPGDLRESFDRDLESHLMAELDRLDLEPYFSENGDTVNFHKFIKDNPSFRAHCSKAISIFLGDILVETSDDLLQLEGGMERLIDRLAAAIKATVKCDREVVAINARADSVEVSWLENGELQTHDCDYVLCTIPFSILKNLELTGFDDRKLASIQNTVYCPATKVILHCAEPFWEQEGIGGGASLGGDGIHQIYYPSIESNPDRGSVLLASYTIGKDTEHLDIMSDPQRCFYVRDWVSQMHPAINTPGVIVDAATVAWGNYQWSNGGCTIPWGGDLSDEFNHALKYLEAARPLNRLFFAGEHCSRFPAWLQGSIESSLEAIHQIVSHQPIDRHEVAIDTCKTLRELGIGNKSIGDMSILNFPRLHFQGFARIHAPTGHQNGLVDLSTNTAYMEGQPFDLDRPISEYHEYLQSTGSRFNDRGEWDETGAFSTAKGWDFGGNGHFAIEAKIVSAQREPGQIDLNDVVVGRSVDLWGHHNEYLGTTFNRTRIFDVDPASNWTTTVMIGQLTFGREGTSQEVPNLFSAPVEGLQPARWQNFNYIQNLPEHCLNREFQQASVHQFTVAKAAPDFFWGDEVADSPTVELLRQAMDRADVLGLVVQFSLSNMSAPLQPDSATFWNLHGTIGLWCEGESSTYPAGRLLIPAGDVDRETANSTAPLLSNLSVRVTDRGVSLNTITAVPCIARAPQSGPGPTHAIGPKRDLGELELRTLKSHQLVATIPQQAYQQEAHLPTSGIIDLPLAAAWADLRTAIEQEGLYLIGTMPDGQRRVLLEEQQINLQIDEGALFLEFPNRKLGEDYAVEVAVRSFVRGQPAPIESVYLSQYYNPRGLPQLRHEFERDPAKVGRDFHFPHSSQLNMLEFKPGKRSEAGDFATGCALATDRQGLGWLTIRGCRSGTTRVLLSADPQALPVDRYHPDVAELSYDNDDRLGFWSGAGSFAVRVMGDDWHLADIPDRDVDFDLIYKEILAYYELCFSFMKAEVFSLADKCKVETYARLMWQMCDPQNKNKTYYMPPTRELSQPKAMLLYKYLQNQQQIGYVPDPTPTTKQPQRTIADREELIVALRQAAELEVAVMLQYIYAAYSIPNYATGQAYVQRGLWTPAQLNLACGDGQETGNYGMRGVLLEISHEEMIHFLLVNNILMAMGEPFYPANPNFGEIDRYCPIDVDLALEPLNASSIQRFMRLEMPDFLAEELAERHVEDPIADRLHRYGSLSELYCQIRQGIEQIPDLFLTKKGPAGGEHHLFLRDDFNQHHPHYQLQVEDVNSALFAIDVITEQGEGCDANSPKFDRSHYQQFRRMAAALAQEQFASDNSDPVVWNPAYPALRNPTLHSKDCSTSVVTAAETAIVMQICDESYFIMMQLMVQHFGLMPNGSLRRSKLMNAAIDIMAGMVRPLGELLMTMPSGKRGRTAGPSFNMATQPVYIPTPEIAYQAIARRFEKLSHQAKKCPAISSTITELFDFYVTFFAEMAID